MQLGWPASSVQLGPMNLKNELHPKIFLLKKSHGCLFISSCCCRSLLKIRPQKKPYACGFFLPAKPPSQPRCQTKGVSSNRNSPSLAVFWWVLTGEGSFVQAWSVRLEDSKETCQSYQVWVYDVCFWRPPPTEQIHDQTRQCFRRDLDGAHRNEGISRHPTLFGYFSISWHPLQLVNT